MPTETLLDLLHEEKKIVKEKHDTEFELMREKHIKEEFQRYPEKFQHMDISVASCDEKINVLYEKICDFTEAHVDIQRKIAICIRDYGKVL